MNPICCNYFKNDCMVTQKTYLFKFLHAFWSFVNLGYFMVKLNDWVDACNLYQPFVPPPEINLPNADRGNASLIKKTYDLLQPSCLLKKVFNNEAPLHNCTTYVPFSKKSCFIQGHECHTLSFNNSVRNHLDFKIQRNLVKVPNNALF